jgi:hypothetical protein
VNSRVFRQDLENEIQDIVEELASSQMKGETTKLTCQGCRSTSHFQEICPHRQQEETGNVSIKLLSTSSPTEGAM